MAGGLPVEDRKQLVLRAPRGPVLFCLGRVVRRAASTFSFDADGGAESSDKIKSRRRLGHQNIRTRGGVIRVVDQVSSLKQQHSCGDRMVPFKPGEPETPFLRFGLSGLYVLLKQLK